MRTPERACLRMVVIPLILVLGGCVTDNEEPAPTAPLSVNEGVSLASRIQQQKQELTATLGGGDSMEPLYTENTIILTVPAPFEELEKAMIVAYYHHTGKIVIHELLRKERDGWLAIGVNNPRVDPDKVTADNFLGIVYGVIYTEGKNTGDM